MLSYSRILRQSYFITVRQPVLWLFGLFVFGGFNINFLHFGHKQLSVKIYRISDQFLSDPGIRNKSIPISVTGYPVSGYQAGFHIVANLVHSPLEYLLLRRI